MKELTDVEICKKIAEIEGIYEELIDRKDRYNELLVHVQDKAEFTRWFNPVCDGRLCFELMIKHDMPPMRVEENGLYECIFDIDKALSGAGVVSDISPNRAICLGIIKANEELAN